MAAHAKRWGGRMVMSVLSEEPLSKSGHLDNTLALLVMSGMWTNVKL